MLVVRVPCLRSCLLCSLWFIYSYFRLLWCWTKAVSGSGFSLLFLSLRQATWRHFRETSFKKVCCSCPGLMVNFDSVCWRLRDLVRKKFTSRSLLVAWHCRIFSGGDDDYKGDFGLGAMIALTSMVSHITPMLGLSSKLKIRSMTVNLRQYICLHMLDQLGGVVTLTRPLALALALTHMHTPRRGARGPLCVGCMEHGATGTCTCVLAVLWVSWASWDIGLRSDSEWWDVKEWWEFPLTSSGCLNTFGAFLQGLMCKAPATGSRLEALKW